jgi:hypothetical protein
MQSLMTQLTRLARWPVILRRDALLHKMIAARHILATPFHLWMWKIPAQGI